MGLIAAAGLWAACENQQGAGRSGSMDDQRSGSGQSQQPPAPDPNSWTNSQQDVTYPGKSRANTNGSSKPKPHGNGELKAVPKPAPGQDYFVI